MKELRQLFDDASFTYTYILTDLLSNEAVIIDPVDTHLNEYLNIIRNNQLKLKYVMGNPCTC